MTIQPQADVVGVLLSGGLDSAILAAHLLERGRTVQPFYVRGGLLWEAEERAAIRAFLAAIARPTLRPLIEMELPLADLYGQHWSLNGRETPGSGTPDEAVFLPGRNPLLIIKAAIWCQMNGITELALAPLESNPFGDATDEFFADFEKALVRACGSPLRIIRPFARFSKKEVLPLGRGLPLELTFSCLRPIGGQHCGDCNKCEERQEAFHEAGIDDPTVYAPRPTSLSP